MLLRKPFLLAISAFLLLCSVVGTSVASPSVQPPLADASQLPERGGLPPTEEAEDEESFAPDGRICQWASGGYYLSRCRQARSNEHSEIRATKISAMAAAWPRLASEKFSLLLHAADGYCRARLDEFKPQGSMYAGIMASDTTEILDDLVDALVAFEQGQLPHFSAAEAAKVERDLTRAYGIKLKAQRLAEQSPDARFLTWEPEDSSKVQPVWLAFRKVVVEFGLLRYPSVMAHEWRAYFALKRIRTLEQEY